MKFKSLVVAIFACLLFIGNNAFAQLNIGSPVQISNVTSFATFSTNGVTVYFPPVTAYLSGCTNTNTVFIGSYVGTLTNVAGSNITIVASVTNTFLASTNNTNISVPGVSYTVPVYWQYQTSVNSNYTLNLQVH
jgi:YbbR domain-containing protein